MEMLFDQHKRNIDYLRISVTDRCNLRCIYCIPDDNIVHKQHQDMLTFEEIAEIARIGTILGINKIKITGGEPFVRKDLPQLISRLNGLERLKDLSLTTNGVLLHKYVMQIEDAGITKLNISIDTLDSVKFKRITRHGEIEDVLDGIYSALENGFYIKLNVVIMKGINDDEVYDFVEFAKKNNIIVRFIELMPMMRDHTMYSNLYISCDEIKESLRLLGELKEVDSAIHIGNGPARYYTLGVNSSLIGFITPISCKFCCNCNRLRLTADGFLMPCLADKKVVNLKAALRGGRDDYVLHLIKRAVYCKREGHNFNFAMNDGYQMSQIGG